MKIFFAACLILILPIYATAIPDEYNSQYCKDPEETAKWASILEKNPDSDAVAALHALWIGLCLKVEARNLTTARANKIFEDFKWGLIEMSREKQGQGKGDSM